MARLPLAILLLLILVAVLVGTGCLSDAGPDITPKNTSPAASPDATDPAAAGSSQGTGAGLAAESDADISNGENPGIENTRDEPVGGAPAQSDASQAEPQESDADTAAGGPVPAPLEAKIFVEPAQITQGNVFVIAIDSKNASAASVALDGQFISMSRDGDRFYAILPVPVATPVGQLSMVVAVADLEGSLALRELVQVEVLPANFPTELIELDLTLSRLLDPDVIAEDRAVRDAVQSVRSPLRFWQGYFELPTAGVITSEFGLLRSYNGAEPTDFHTGMDFAGALGEDVRAANAGVVAWTGETERRGRGIIVDHGGGVFSSYWHLSSVATALGTPVATGSVIGRLGTTGLSTGPHLHWELTIYGVPVDPLPWLRELEVPNPLASFDPLHAVNTPNDAVALP